MVINLKRRVKSPEKIKNFMKVRWKSISAFTLIAVLFAILLLLVTYYYRFQNHGEKVERCPVEYMLSIGKRSGKASLKGPLSVAVSEGKVYVADSANGEIKVFTPRGTFLFSFSVTNNGHTVYPVGIVVGPDRNIYVSEIKSQRLMVFDSNGEYLHDFPKKHKVMIKPLALAYANKKFYVTDVGDHTVKIFDLSGNFLKKIGKSGNGIGEFSYPNGIAVDKDGKIYVADSNNGRVQVFNADGKYEFKIGGRNASKKILYLPRGIAIDSLHRIHVSDPFAHGVFVFNTEGKYLFSYGQKGKSGFMTPNGIAVGRENANIYVTDRVNNSVEVWSY